MTETNEKVKNKKLGLSRPKKLELKKTVETGQVRQNFSHGRSKMVMVEVKKKRSFERDAVGGMTEIKRHVSGIENKDKNDEKNKIDKVVAREEEAPAVDEAGSKLTVEERNSRAKALKGALTEESVLPERQETETSSGGEENQEENLSEPEPVLEPEVAVEASPSNEKKEHIKSPKPFSNSIAEDTDSFDFDDEHRGRGKKAGKSEPRRSQGAPSYRREEPRRRSGKLTISEALEEREGRQRSLASVKRQREKEREKAVEARSEGKKVIREVIIPEAITVQELANRMAEQAVDVIKVLMNMDLMVTVNQIIDADTAELVVEEFGHNYKRVSESDVEIGLKGIKDKDSHLEPRAPVVTIMGHVDHGKTSLLDALRKTDVALHETGGITQHIGAYQVNLSSGSKITFLDTPGHEAFSEIRSRGARVTDIVVLCIAADDGIMPQTVEAISHAQSANVPIIVAINKIDKPEANAKKLRTDLLQHNIQVEEVGGEVLSIEVSATKRQHLDKLEEAILLQAELMDLRANPKRAAEGVVIEAKMEQGRGPVATVLVQRGTLQVGDIFVAGKEWGKVRAMFDGLGSVLESAGPAVPAEVLGLSGVPNAGDEIAAVESESRAREISEFRWRKNRTSVNVASSRGTLEQMFERIKEGEAQILPVVVKADVHGSVEAITSALKNLSTDEVRTHILHSAVGGINESDITLARASEAPILGFNVRANPQARAMAARENVELRYYSIIYNLVDDLRNVMSGMLAPDIRETFIGNALVKEVFNVSKVGKVAGCIVTEGQVRRGAKVRLIREEVVVHEGELSQLKRYKDDVQEVNNGTECGVAFLNYNDMKAGDTVECFSVEEVARKL